MSSLTRLAHLLAACLSLGAALAIVAAAGLPERSDYSGIRIDASRATAPEIGSTAPPFTLATASGGRFALEAARGYAVIINFWASWCQPCQREMRDLQTLYESYPGKLRIVAVNLGESLQVARDWANRLGLTYDILVDPGGAVAARYQVRGLPTTYVLDGDHRIRRLYYGAARPEELLQDLRQLVRKA